MSTPSRRGSTASGRWALVHQPSLSSVLDATPSSPADDAPSSHKVPFPPSFPKRPPNAGSRRASNAGLSGFRNVHPILESDATASSFDDAAARVSKQEEIPSHLLAIYHATLESFQQKSEGEASRDVTHGLKRASTRELLALPKRPKPRNMTDAKDSDDLRQELFVTKTQLNMLQQEKRIWQAKLVAMERSHNLMEKRFQDQLLTSAIMKSHRSRALEDDLPVLDDKIITNLRKSLRAMEDKLKERDKQIEQLKQSTKFRKLIEYEREVNKYYLEAIRLRRQLEHRESGAAIVAEGGENLLTYDDAINELKAKLEDSEAANIQLQERSEALRDHREKLRGTIESLVERLRELQDSHDQLIQDHDGALGTIQRLEERAENLQEQLSISDGLVTEKTSELGGLQQDFSDLARKCEEKEEAIQQRQRELEDEQQNVADLRDKLSGKEEEIEHLNQLAARNEDDRKAKEQELLGQIKDLLETVEDLHATISRQQKQTQALTDDNTTLHTSYQRERTVVVDLQQQLSATQQHVTETYASVRSLEGELSVARDRARGLESELDTSYRRQDELRGEIEKTYVVRRGVEKELMTTKVRVLELEDALGLERRRREILEGRVRELEMMEENHRVEEEARALEMGRIKIMEKARQKMQSRSEDYEESYTQTRDSDVINASPPRDTPPTEDINVPFTDDAETPITVDFKTQSADDGSSASVRFHDAPSRRESADGCSVVESNIGPMALREIEYIDRPAESHFSQLTDEIHPESSASNAGVNSEEPEPYRPSQEDIYEEETNRDLRQRGSSFELLDDDEDAAMELGNPQPQSLEGDSGTALESGLPFGASAENLALPARELVMEPLLLGESPVGLKPPKGNDDGSKEESLDENEIIPNSAEEKRRSTSSHLRSSLASVDSATRNEAASRKTESPLASNPISRNSQSCSTTDAQRSLASLASAGVAAKYSKSVADADDTANGSDHHASREIIEADYSWDELQNSSQLSLNTAKSNSINSDGDVSSILTPTPQGAVKLDNDVVESSNVSTNQSLESNAAPADAGAPLLPPLGARSKVRRTYVPTDAVNLEREAPIEPPESAVSTIPRHSNLSRPSSSHVELAASTPPGTTPGTPRGRKSSRNLSKRASAASLRGATRSRSGSQGGDNCRTSVKRSQSRSGSRRGSRPGSVAAIERKKSSSALQASNLGKVEASVDTGKDGGNSRDLTGPAVERTETELTLPKMSATVRAEMEIPVVTKEAPVQASSISSPTTTAAHLALVNQTRRGGPMASETVAAFNEEDGIVGTVHGAKIEASIRISGSKAQGSLQKLEAIGHELPAQSVSRIEGLVRTIPESKERQETALPSETAFDNPLVAALPTDTVTPSFSTHQKTPQDIDAAVSSAVTPMVTVPELEARDSAARSSEKGATLGSQSALLETELSQTSNRKSRPSQPSPPDVKRRSASSADALPRESFASVASSFSLMDDKPTEEPALAGDGPTPRSETSVANRSLRSNGSLEIKAISQHSLASAGGSSAGSIGVAAAPRLVQVASTTASQSLWNFVDSFGSRKSFKEDAERASLIQREDGPSAGTRAESNSELGRTATGEISSGDELSRYAETSKHDPNIPTSSVTSLISPEPRHQASPRASEPNISAADSRSRQILAQSEEAATGENGQSSKRRSPRKWVATEEAAAEGCEQEQSFKPASPPALKDRSPRKWVPSEEASAESDEHEQPSNSAASPPALKAHSPRKWTPTEEVVVSNREQGEHISLRTSAEAPPVETLPSRKWCAPTENLNAGEQSERQASTSLHPAESCISAVDTAGIKGPLDRTERPLEVSSATEERDRAVSEEEADGQGHAEDESQEPQAEGLDSAEIDISSLNDELESGNSSDAEPDEAKPEKTAQALEVPSSERFENEGSLQMKSGEDGIVAIVDSSYSKQDVTTERQPENDTNAVVDAVEIASKDSNQDLAVDGVDERNVRDLAFGQDGGERAAEQHAAGRPEAVEGGKDGGLAGQDRESAEGGGAGGSSSSSFGLLPEDDFWLESGSIRSGGTEPDAAAGGGDSIDFDIW